jgi:hypothetical protein
MVGVDAAERHSGATGNLVGSSVEALDGGIGKINE